MNWMQLALAGMGFVLGGGLTGFVASLVKVRAEAGKIIIDSAEGAVVVQASVIEELRNELQLARKDVAQARLDVAELRKELQIVSERLGKVLAENDALKRKIAALSSNQNRHDEEIRGLNKH